ncbi:hypothetical protein D3C75_415230 [compost metagenome]
MKKNLFFGLLVLLLLSGCSSETPSWKGSSTNWTAEIQSAKNDKGDSIAVFSIKHIGNETELSNVTYQFNGQVMTAKGLYNSKVYPASFQIDSNSQKNIENEKDPITLEIKWNKDKKVTINLKKN